MGRRKLELKPIEDSSKRHTTFTKRRQGLNKKAQEYCEKYDGEAAAVIVYSKSGNAYFFGHPRCDTIMDRYISEYFPSFSSSSPSSSAVVDPIEVEEEEDAEDDKIMEAEAKIAESIGKGPIEWDKMVSGLGIEDLDRLAEVAERIKRELAAECQSRSS